MSAKYLRVQRSFRLVLIIFVIYGVVRSLFWTQKETTSSPSEDSHIFNKIYKMEESAESLQPILTIFTTFKDIHIRDEIHQRTIVNWAELRPFIVPILFVPLGDNITKWSKEASAKGWEVRIADNIIQGVPVLKSMFQDIQNNYATDFIGFANADILFDESLLWSLFVVRDVISNLANQNVMIIGRRRNADIYKYDLDVKSGGLRRTASRLDLHRSNAQDYFILSRRGLPWDDVPPFVVGRIGYDNWLVSKALQWNVTLIDASFTVLAVHQEGIDGIKAGHQVSDDQKLINMNMIGKGFRFDHGETACAPWKLTCEGSLQNPFGFLCEKGDIRLVETPKRGAYLRCLS